MDPMLRAAARAVRRRLFIPLRRRARAAIERRRLLRRDPGAPLRIVVGADGRAQPGWYPTEVEFLNLVRPEDWRRLFAPESIDAILAEHVFQELTPDEGLEAARLCFAYLRPGGYLRVAVPDGCHPEPAYLEWVRPGGGGRGADKTVSLPTYRTLTDLVERAGFIVHLLEWWDDTGVYHAAPWDPAEGLIRRSPRFDRTRRAGVRRYTSLILDARKPARDGP